MHHSTSYALTLLAVACSLSLAIYVPLTEYAGETFFDAWDFDGTIDDTTWGNVTYLNKAAAMSSNLVYVDETTGHAIIRVDNTTNFSNASTVYRDSIRIVSQNTYTEGNLIIIDVAHMPAGCSRLAYVDETTGHAIIRVDNTTNIANATVVNRPSVRITTQDTYGEGNLIILDVAHLPTGCSVWPSFWTLGVGATWPGAGEIDIIEGINLVNNNQMALHTTPSNPGCVQPPNVLQTGKIATTNCSSTSDDNRGCVVLENKPNSFGSGFNNAGGGVFATQIDLSGVFIWFWSRADVPASISGATQTSNIDTTTFGTPSAAYPAAGCNVTEFFGPQQLVILTTLCGLWAGLPDIYPQTCPGTCLANVIGDGSAYNDAWWDIAFLRIYQAEDQAPATPSTLAPAGTGTSLPTAVTTTNGTAHQGNGSLKISQHYGALHGLILSGILLLLCCV
ncbi:hypothetical protein H0H93_015017 [Arthromyces matolae]|nr:hypothetical protein H0H93_015017 [Arthromyces matolae]